MRQSCRSNQGCSIGKIAGGLLVSAVLILGGLAQCFVVVGAEWRGRAWLAAQVVEEGLARGQGATDER